MKTEHWKKDLICPVCGITFKGTMKAQVCGSTCRGRLSRILEAGKKPEFYLLAQTKGQKLPPLDAEKRLVFKKTPVAKKVEEQTLDQSIQYKKSEDLAYDGGRSSMFIMDEVGQMPPIQPLTKEVILLIISAHEKEIAAIEKESLPPGMMPKSHVLNKEIRIDEIKDKIEKLRKEANKPA